MRSVFDGFHEDELACPVARCLYRFPRDLEGTAIARHRNAHSSTEWDEIETRLRRDRAELLADASARTNSIDADLARLAHWLGKD